MADNKAGRVIFIGNIPYGLTEEQIVHIFSSAGQVLNFRLVYDADTGRPKGFGFCEFADADTAGSAVRNLDGYEIMNRELRVDFSHVGGKDSDNPPPSAGIQQMPIQLSANTFAPQASNALPPLPPGVELPAGVTCPDAISKTLSTLAPAQLLDILSQMKGLVMGDPTKATELLKQAPQLAYAMFQALLLMGLVDTSVLASVVEVGNQNPQALAPPQPQAPPSHTPSYQPPSHTPIPSYQPQHSQMSAPTPPIYGQAYQPPPMPQPSPAPQATSMQPSQEDLLKQVMAMTQQQIDQLGPVERSQIMALRASMGAR